MSGPRIDDAVDLIGQLDEHGHRENIVAIRVAVLPVEIPREGRHSVITHHDDHRVIEQPDGLEPVEHAAQVPIGRHRLHHVALHSLTKHLRIRRPPPLRGDAIAGTEVVDPAVGKEQERFVWLLLVEVIEGRTLDTAQTVQERLEPRSIVARCPV